MKILLQGQKPLLDVMPLIVVALFLSSGCTSDRTARRVHPRPDNKFVETVSARAPFDLSCPPAQVQLVGLGSSTLGARGCGRRTSYSCICTYHMGFDCTQATCSLDSATTVQPPIPQEQPASSQSQSL